MACPLYPTKSGSALNLTTPHQNEATLSGSVVLFARFELKEGWIKPSRTTRINWGATVLPDVQSVSLPVSTESVRAQGIEDFTTSGGRGGGDIGPLFERGMQLRPSVIAAFEGEQYIFGSVVPLPS